MFNFPCPIIHFFFDSPFRFTLSISDPIIHVRLSNGFPLPISCQIIHVRLSISFSIICFVSYYPFPVRLSILCPFIRINFLLFPLNFSFLTFSIVFVLTKHITFTLQLLCVKCTHQILLLFLFCRITLFIDFLHLNYFPFCFMIPASASFILQIILLVFILLHFPYFFERFN